MPALLEETAVTRVDLFESKRSAQSVRNPPKVALVDGDQQQDVAIFGDFSEEGLGGRQGRGEMAPFQERPDSPDLRFDAGWRRLRFCDHDGAYFGSPLNL
jgi:hypothetical protein